MSQARHEWKVGLFVLFGLALLAGLLILFSKGLSFAPTYTLRLKAVSAGILKPRASVVMAGVPIGSIAKIELAPDGRNVTIQLRIQKAHIIRNDARFAIEQSGFLGDQYVTVIPVSSDAAPLKEGDEVTAEAPFDLQEVARSARGFIGRIDETAKRLNDMIEEFHRETLNKRTLSNLSESIGALHAFSEEARIMVGNLNYLVETNTEPIATSLKNIQDATASLTNILAGVEEGHGLAGTLLKNEDVATNLASLVENLDTFSGNLNRYGIWKMLWKPPQSGLKSAAEEKQQFKSPLPTKGAQ